MSSLPQEFARTENISFEITEASEVTVTPTSVTVVPKEKDMAALAIYKRNVWLFLALVVSSSAWFYLHFENYFSQLLVVGIPLTYAVWQVGFSYWNSFWAKNAEELRQKWLSQKSTTLQLIGFCAGVLLFLAGTSSIWISLSGATTTATFEVRYKGRPFMQRVELSDTSRIGGRLFFPRIVPRRVEVVVTDPKRWTKKGVPSQMLWPWAAINLEFPGDFYERPKRALRIVPGMSLHDDVTNEGGTYTLTIQEGAQPPIILRDYPFMTVYVGVKGQDEIADLYHQYNTAAWSDLLERQLIDDEVSPENAKHFASHWVARGISIWGSDFSDKSTVNVTVGVPGQPPIAAAASEVLTKEMTTLMLEKKR
jgi:hypothetical protein